MTESKDLRLLCTPIATPAATLIDIYEKHLDLTPEELTHVSRFDYILNHETELGYFSDDPMYSRICHNGMLLVGQRIQEGDCVCSMRNMYTYDDSSLYCAKDNQVFAGVRLYVSNRIIKICIFTIPECSIESQVFDPDQDKYVKNPHYFHLKVHSMTYPKSLKLKKIYKKIKNVTRLYFILFR